MRNIFEFILKQTYYTSCTIHCLLFIWFFGNNFFYEDSPIEKLYWSYVSSLIFFLFCIFFKSSKIKFNLISCAILLILSTPLLQYNLYPSLTKYLVSKKYWIEFEDNNIYFDEYSITDMISIILFIISYIFRATQTLQNSNIDSVTAE